MPWVLNPKYQDGSIMLDESTPQPADYYIWQDPDPGNTKNWTADDWAWENKRIADQNAKSISTVNTTGPYSDPAGYTLGDWLGLSSAPTGSLGVPTGEWEQKIGKGKPKSEWTDAQWAQYEKLRKKDALRTGTTYVPESRNTLSEDERNKMRVAKKAGIDYTPPKSNAVVEGTKKGAGEAPAQVQVKLSTQALTKDAATTNGNTGKKWKWGTSK